MKYEELKVTKQMLYESSHQGFNIYGIKQAYCDLHDCCESCNKRVRFWCNVITKIEDWQTRIINKIVRD